MKYKALVTANPKIRPIRIVQERAALFHPVRRPAAVPRSQGRKPSRRSCRPSARSRSSWRTTGCSRAATCLWDGVIIKEIHEMFSVLGTPFTNVGAGGTTEVGLAFLCGAQAVAAAYAQTVEVDDAGLRLRRQARRRDQLDLRHRQDAVRHRAPATPTTSSSTASSPATSQPRTKGGSDHGNRQLANITSRWCTTCARRSTFNSASASAGNIDGRRHPAATAIVATSSGVWITTAFNGTGPLINVGVTGTPALYASALVASAIGFQALDDVALAAAVPVATERTVTANFTYTGTPTAGSAEIVVAYVPGSR